MTTYNFSTIKLGKSISKHRKEQNLTQGELAELLGVSHQAISSWENGLTCPDISKLSELSRIFKVSIDDIFENNSMGHIVSKVERDEPLEEEEIVVVAPLTKPNTLESIIDHADTHSFKVDTMVALAPFAEESQLESWVERFDFKSDLRSIVPLAPFIPSKTILRIVNDSVRSGDSPISALVPLAPFLDSDDLDTLILSTLASCSLNDIIPLAPFASNKALSKLIESCVNKDTFNIKEVVNLAPFLSDDDLDLLLGKLSGGSLHEIVPLAPFLSEETLSKIVQTQRRKENFNPKKLTSLAPFLNKDLLKEIVEESVKNGNIKDVKGLFPFV